MEYTRSLAIGSVLAVIGGCTTTVVSAPPTAADGGIDPDGGVAGDPATDPAAADAAACIAPGDNCRGIANACCNGSTCVFDTKDTSKAVCAATCLNDSQCKSGCCKVLVEGTQAVCAPANYCAGACSKPGQDCRTQACCANATCVVSTVTGTSCAARCAVSSQCASGCCAPLDNTGELVCSPATFCR
jgi:hypothetical protein